MYGLNSECVISNVEKQFVWRTALTRKEKPDLLDIVTIIWIVVFLLFYSRALFGSWAGQYSYLVAELFLLACVLTYLRLRKRCVRELISLNEIRLLPWITSIGISISALIIFDGLSVLTNLFLPVPENVIETYSKAYKSANAADLIVLIMGVVIGASFVEEIIFRGIIQRNLLTRMKPFAAIVITSLAFGAVHLQIWWIVQLVLFALLAGWLSWISGSLIPAITLHILNNLWSLLKYQDGLNLGSHYPLQNNHLHYMIIACALLLFVVFVCRFRSYYIHKA